MSWSDYKNGPYAVVVEQSLVIVVSKLDNDVLQDVCSSRNCRMLWLRREIDMLGSNIMHEVFT